MSKKKTLSLFLLMNSRKTGTAWPPEFLTLSWRHAAPFALLMNSRKTGTESGAPPKGQTSSFLAWRCASALFALLCASFAAAQPVQPARPAASAPSKIGIVNLQAVIANTKEGQKASQQLQQTFSGREKDFQGRSDELNKLNEQLKAGGTLLSDEKRNQLTSDIAEKKHRLDRDIQDAQKDLNGEQQRVLGTMEQKLRPMIDKYAKDNNFAVVMDVGRSNVVVFASSAADITKDIIDLYDRANPVTTTSPATSGPSTSNPTTSTPPTSSPRAPGVPGQTAPRPAPGTPRPQSQ
jgi:outer membrane protein